jgi:hypothetical protein
LVAIRENKSGEWGVGNSGPPLGIRGNGEWGAVFEKNHCSGCIRNTQKLMPIAFFIDNRYYFLLSLKSNAIEKRDSRVSQSLR